MAPTAAAKIPAPSAPASAVAVNNGSAARAPDLLRKERFGALYYSRRAGRFFAVPIRAARLLVAGARESVLDAYARESDECGVGFGVDESHLVAQVIRWQRDGLLDAEYRCTARVLDNDRASQGLTAPLVTHLQLTRACNASCRHCYVSVAPRPSPNELSTARVLELFAELDALGSPVVILAGGEPLMRDDLGELIGGVERHNIDAWLCTNATLVDEPIARLLAASTLRGVSVSLDGADAETHDALRGPGHFARAVRGIRRLVDAGAASVKLRVTVTAHNADRLAKLPAVARDTGAHEIAIKPFRRSGASATAVDLGIDRATYSRAMDALRREWPTDVAVDIGDGTPSRLPPWTRIMPEFGCVGGNTAVTVSYDGKVTGCGSVLRPSAWSLDDHTFADCWRGSPGIDLWRAIEPTDGARRLERESPCGGGCRARAVGAGDGFGGVDPWLV